MLSKNILVYFLRANDLTIAIRTGTRFTSTVATLYVFTSFALTGTVCILHNFYNLIVKVTHKTLKFQKRCRKSHLFFKRFSSLKKEPLFLPVFKREYRCICQNLKKEIFIGMRKDIACLQSNTI